MRKLTAYCDLTAEQLYEFFFTGAQAPAKLHDSGRISSKEFFEIARRDIPLPADLSYEQFRGIWCDIFSENPGIEAVLSRILPEVRQRLLSNTDPLHWPIIERIPVMRRYFSDPAILVRSYTSNARKPDEKIYRDALAVLGVAQGEENAVIYVEDVPKYRSAFAQLGGKTLAYNCAQDPLETLIGGLVSARVLGNLTGSIDLLY